MDLLQLSSFQILKAHSFVALQQHPGDQDAWHITKYHLDSLFPPVLVVRLGLASAGWRYACAALHLMPLVTLYCYHFLFLPYLCMVMSILPTPSCW